MIRSGEHALWDAHRARGRERADLAAFAGAAARAMRPFGLAMREATAAMARVARAYEAAMQRAGADFEGAQSGVPLCIGRSPLEGLAATMRGEAASQRQHLADLERPQDAPTTEIGMRDAYCEALESPVFAGLSSRALCETRTRDPFLTMVLPVSRRVTPGHTESPSATTLGATRDPAGHPRRPQNAPTSGAVVGAASAPTSGAGSFSGPRSLSPANGAHFATFPPKLIEPCVLAGCPEGGTVLDPFAGAGTSGLVARRLRRSFVGIELNPEYAQMARDRIETDVRLGHRPPERVTEPHADQVSIFDLEGAA